MNCILHPDREAVRALKVPCAPGGQIGICAECNDDPDIVAKTFDHYRGGHAKRIKVFKQPANPEN